jgi:hypothetical protein
MSALGHQRTVRYFRVMSALPPKADIDRRLSYDPNSTAQLFAAVLCAIWTYNDAVTFACVGNTPDGAAGIISD